MVVELQYKNSKQLTTGSQNGKITDNSGQRSIFVGWTGMPSQRRLGSGVGSGGGRLASGEFSEATVVEIDATFGRLIGLADKQKVIRLDIETMSPNHITGGHRIASGSSADRYCSYRTTDTC